MGWRLAAVVVATVCIAMIVLTWPFQSRIDLPPEQRVQRRLISFRLTDILVPLRSLSHGDRLWRASWVGALLAIAQAGWVTFMVTYLVAVVGQPLRTAGLIFAVMQASSMFGRICLGWIADRLASGPMTLMIAAFGSAVTTILLGLSTSVWPLWAFVLLAAVAGIAVSGWNGVQIAEVARRSPPELIGETAAGSVILIFAANMLTPIAFAAFVAVTGRYDLAFLISGAFSLICLPLLYGIDRRTEKAAG
jgi:predicted MFS family arabinose efflux permease